MPYSPEQRRRSNYTEFATKDQFSSTLGELFTAGMDQVLDDYNPVGAVGRWLDYRDQASRTPENTISREEFRQTYGFNPPTGIERVSRKSVPELIRLHERKQKREDVFSHSAGDVPSVLASMGGSVVGSLYDPVNILTGLVPVGRALPAIKGASIARVAARGAAEGALSAAYATPLFATAAAATNSPYGLSDVATDILFSAGLGGAGSGLVAGLSRLNRNVRTQFREMGADLPQSLQNKAEVALEDVGNMAVAHEMNTVAPSRIETQALEWVMMQEVTEVLRNQENITPVDRGQAILDDFLQQAEAFRTADIPLTERVGNRLSSEEVVAAQTEALARETEIVQSEILRIEEELASIPVPGKRLTKGLENQRALLEKEIGTLEQEYAEAKSQRASALGKTASRKKQLARLEAERDQLQQQLEQVQKQISEQATPKKRPGRKKKAAVEEAEQDLNEVYTQTANRLSEVDQEIVARQEELATALPEATEKLRSAEEKLKIAKQSVENINHELKLETQTRNSRRIKELRQQEKKLRKALEKRFEEGEAAVRAASEAASEFILPGPLMEMLSPDEAAVFSLGHKPGNAVVRKLIDEVEEALRVTKALSDEEDPASIQAFQQMREVAGDKLEALDAVVDALPEKSKLKQRLQENKQTLLELEAEVPVTDPELLRTLLDDARAFYKKVLRDRRVQNPDVIAKAEASVKAIEAKIERQRTGTLYTLEQAAAEGRLKLETLPLSEWRERYPELSDITFKEARNFLYNKAYGKLNNLRQWAVATRLGQVEGDIPVIGNEALGRSTGNKLAARFKEAVQELGVSGEQFYEAQRVEIQNYIDNLRDLRELDPEVERHLAKLEEVYKETAVDVDTMKRLLDLASICTALDEG